MRSTIAICALFFVLLCNFLTAHEIWLPIQNTQTSLTTKTSHDLDEPFGKGLPLGPSSIKFVENEIWVTDSLASRIARFDANANYLSSIKIDIKNAYPIDFCINPLNNTIWVLDEDNGIVIILDSNYNLLTTIREFKQRQLVMPKQIVALPTGDVLVIDAGLNRILRFSLDYKLTAAYPSIGTIVVLHKDHFLYMAQKDERPYLLKRDFDGKILQADIINHPLDLEPRLVASDEYANPILALVSDSEEPSLDLVLFNSKENDIKINVSWPPPFINNFIIDNNGTKYILSYDEEENNVLKLFSISLEFSASSGSG